jgi:hypothetical protein
MGLTACSRARGESRGRGRAAGSDGDAESLETSGGYGWW